MPEVAASFLLDSEWAVEREIWKCLPVETLFVSPEDLGKYDVRKVPELRGLAYLQRHLSGSESLICLLCRFPGTRCLL